MKRAIDLLMLIYLHRLIHPTKTDAEAMQGTYAHLKTLLARLSAAESAGDPTAAAVFNERAENESATLDRM